MWVKDECNSTKVQVQVIHVYMHHNVVSNEYYQLICLETRTQSHDL